MDEKPAEMATDDPQIARDEGVIAQDGGDEEANLTPLHPNYKKLLRLVAIIVSIPFLIATLIAEVAAGLPWPGLIFGPAVLLALIIIFRVPMRRYAARGYAMSEDRLRVVRGIWWKSDSVVPFGRVQHIDVEQGPLERIYGLATITVHTAGTHNASVRLPGLEESLARDMREDIRQHIKRDTI